MAEMEEATSVQNLVYKTQKTEEATYVQKLNYTAVSQPLGGLAGNC
jgi:hypothetical protein